MSDWLNGRVLEPADVQHPDHVVVAEQRHAEHVADALLPQDRVVHGRFVHPVEGHRLAQLRDRAGEADAHRHPDALAHLLLQPARRPGDQLLRTVVEQQHRRGVGVEDRADPVQQLGKHLLDVEPAEVGCR